MAQEQAEKEEENERKESNKRKKQEQIAAIEDDIVSTDRQTEGERVTTSSRQLKHTFVRETAEEEEEDFRGGRAAIAAARKMPANTSVTDAESAQAVGEHSESTKKSNKQQAAAHVGKSGVKQDWVESSQANRWPSASSENTHNTSTSMTKMVAKPPTTPNPTAKKAHSKQQLKTPITVKERGFVNDSDEDIEHAAAQSSPAKPPGTRVTSNGIVKTDSKLEKAKKRPSECHQLIKAEPIDDKIQHSTSSDDEIIEVDRKGKPTKGSKKKTALELTLSPASMTRFRKVFMPTVLIGIKVLETIWPAVFGPQHAKPDFEEVTQKLSEWQFSFGQVAIVLYDTHFKSIEKDDLEERAREADHLLTNGLFSYEVQDPKAVKGLFRAPIILKTFAHHFSATDGAVEVPGLYADNAAKRPNGAFALAITAVERALTLFRARLVVSEQGKPKVSEVFNDKTGNTSLARNHFSGDNWARITAGWMSSVLHLSDTKMKTIIERAHAAHEVTTGSSARVSDNEEYDQGNMFDPDSE
ncbi:hypothetical protein A0H81_12059 [Grifola frondosa]|uniref:DUF6532 domain-containing protein n=1 Tax=Grifola frondosa TaxID=5627 RepID=A0A1C7LSN7_GRIFR|nr:hypothetical protein A0H81_12059 [Grifola frondosa]